MGVSGIIQLSDEELIDFIEQNFVIARNVVEGDPETELMPALNVMTIEPDGERTHLVFVFADFDERKYDVLQGIGMQVGSQGYVVPAVALVSEAWMVSYEEADMQLFQAEGGLPMPPREDPRRVEVLVGAGMTADQRVQMKAMRLHRESGCVSLEPFVEVGEGCVESSSDLLRSFYRGYAVSFLSQWMDQLAG